MEEKNTHLKTQIIEAAANVQYTYIAHWKIVNRLKNQYSFIKIAQIILSALVSGGFLTTLISGVSKIGWVGGLTSVVALGLNLYMLNFNILDNIKQHTDAANALWEVREKYKALIIDYDDIDIIEARNRRDELLRAVSEINQKYLGTDERSFKKAKKTIDNYKFNEGEAELVLNINRNNK